MSEFWSIISFEVSKLFQKSWYLSDDPEQIIRTGMIMHLKSLDCLIVLNYRIKRSLLQLLPISWKIILGVRIEEQQKVFNIRNHLFQFKVVSSRVQLIGFLLKLPDTVGSFFEHFGYFLVELLLVEFKILMDGPFETVVFDHPQIFEVHQEGPEDSNKLF